MGLLGVDVSSHQPQIDWAAVKAGGYAFAFIKATGGDEYANPQAAAQFAGARAAGLVVGLYHYDAEPTLHTGTPEEEAAWFLAHLPDPLPPGTLLALDAEERATRDPARYATWLRLVEQATGVRPFLYTYPSFISEIDAAAWAPVTCYPLWYAWYPTDLAAVSTRPLPHPPAPFPRAVIWQYSGGTTIPGIPNPTDADRFDGTLDGLRALGNPAANDNPGFPGALQADGRIVLNTVDFGGTAICAEEVIVQVRNAAGERYRRRWVGYQLEAWEKI